MYFISVITEIKIGGSMKILQSGLIVAILYLLNGCGNDDARKDVFDGVVADIVYQNGYIYTANDALSVAETVAIKSGEIIYVGTTEGVQSYIGEQTIIEDLESKMMLPGLHDAHIHPTGIVDVDMCDLGVKEMNLDELVAALNECKARYKYADDEIIFALQWNSYVGNEPTSNFVNMLAALDSISITQPVFLSGPDGHTAAANSFALNNVKNDKGEVVGLSRATLQEEFSKYVPFVGVDAAGNPNGKLSESAVHLVGVPNFLYPLQQNPEELPKIARKLNKYGITSVQDAWVGPDELALYKQLADSGEMTFRLTAAQKYSVANNISAGVINYNALVNDANIVRDSLQNYPYMKADAIKIMIDGVQEGSLIEVPPTLPTSVMLDNLNQPLVDLSQLDDGIISLNGYVDLDSEYCEVVRSNPENYDEPIEVANFLAVYSFHPTQCLKEKGEALAASGDTPLLKAHNIEPISFLNTFVTALDAADFTVHMHAIGDGAVRLAIDAIESAKNANVTSELPHAIAHLQVVHPDDQQRLGELGIYLAYTYGWAIPDYYYNLSVIPFLVKLDDLAPSTLFDPSNYYMKAIYPTRTTKTAGAVLIAGSDAPVDTREPLPFSHMATGMTRNEYIGDELYSLNSEQVLTVHEMIAAYTINGAKALRQADIVGSIEVGKRADLVIIDRNIVKLAESENPQDVYDIFDTQVLTTIFDGKVVYQSKGSN